MPQKLAKELKARGQPYLSTHGISGVNFNTKVLVAGTEGLQSASDMPVMCRHLSLSFARHLGKKSVLIERFSTKEGVFAEFDRNLGQIDSDFGKIVVQASHNSKHLVIEQHFGNYLKCLGKALDAAFEKGQGASGQTWPREVNCLLLSGNHVMALHLERKNKDKNPYFALKLFDPNDTAIYKRVEKSTAQALSALTLQDLLVDPIKLSAYAPGTAQPLSLVAVCLDPSLQLQINQRATVPTAENLFLSLSCNLPHDVKDILEVSARHLKNLTTRVYSGYFDLLQAKFCSSGETGLSAAFRNNSAAAVEIFTEFVLTSPTLGDKEKVELLRARSRDGISGLTKAFERGHTETVEAFTRVVLASNLSFSDKFDLTGVGATRQPCSTSRVVETSQTVPADSGAPFHQRIEI